MTFRKFLQSMTDDELESYAERCGTTVNYLNVHLRPASRIPRRDLMESLWQESDGSVSRQEIFDHFYPKDQVA